MNKNIWNLYKNSERGQNAISLFTINNDTNIEEKITSIFHFCKDYLGGFAQEKHFITRFFLISDNIFADNLLFEENELVSEYFNRLIDNLEIGYVDITNDGKLIKDRKIKPLIKQQDYKRICSLIPDLSLVLYSLFPDAFIPILFPEKFDVLMKILDVLEIPMPALPASTDKRARLLFYNDLCENIFSFSERHGLSSAETCACIYDFALMLLDNEDSYITDLPGPTNIWITGGSKKDYEQFLKNPTDKATSEWTCNENTKRGDIIVMYVLTPYSCIQSIWRAEIDGVYTPFNYYNSRTKVTDGIVIPQITLNDLRSDKYFSELSIVRKNFQGVNGIKFTAKDYFELQRILIEKGFDVSILPQLYNPNLDFSLNLTNEKDVEEKLLIPLLLKLGYVESDWTRQLSQKVGRKEKAIPDFVFFPKGETLFQNSPMIIEAKYSMESSLERTKSYNQALSYARIMKSSIFAICDKDRIIIYKERNGLFDRFSPVYEKHWLNLNEVEVFAELKLLIGKEIIKKISSH